MVFELTMYVSCVAGDYYLVYWPEEDSMSVVSIGSLREECMVGEECEVKSGRTYFKGKVSAVGKHGQCKVYLMYWMRLTTYTGIIMVKASLLHDCMCAW